MCSSSGGLRRRWESVPNYAKIVSAGTTEEEGEEGGDEKDGDESHAPPPPQTNETDGMAVAAAAAGLCPRLGKVRGSIRRVRAETSLVGN